MSTDQEDFIGTIRPLIGVDAVRDLQLAFGGQRILIPSTPEPHHVLCKAIGTENVAKIVATFGYGPVDVPLGAAGAVAQRRVSIEAGCLAGLTVTQISRDHQCSSRTVFKARARLRKAGLLGTLGASDTLSQPNPQPQRKS